MPETQRTIRELLDGLDPEDVADFSRKLREWADVTDQAATRCTQLTPSEGCWAPPEGA